MRLVCRLFGYEVLSVGLEQEFVEEAEPPTGITGGGGAFFERDGNPPNPSGEEPYYEDKGFGFRDIR